MGVRKCSQCGHTGHNSRTCRILTRTENNGSTMKLFGVQLVGVHSSDDGFGFTKSLSPLDENSERLNAGYISDGVVRTSQGQMRKKGVAWSGEEHRLFLLGLQKLGKGDWRGIAKNFVTTRTSTQVASHAQKYFLRLKNASNRQRPPLASMVRRNEAQFQQVHRNESSISLGVFPKSTASTTDCNCSKEKPISPLFTLPEIPYCRLFNSSATQNSPSLELSLAAPEPPVQSLGPVAFWKKQSVI